MWRCPMPILHVRNVPDELYDRLRHRAAARQRSLSAEVLVLLESALRRPDDGAGLFERLRRRRAQIARAVGSFPSSTDLLREDRER